MTKGLVSVVIPVYNDGRFLVESIESVISQTYPEYEILIIDDGSKNSDELRKLVGPYLSGKIRYIRNEKNIGLAASRNVGIRNCQGEFICFLDADDVFCPQKLEIQVAEFQANPQLSMLFSDEYVIQNGVKVENAQQFPNGYHIPEPIIDTFAKSSFIAVFTVMLRVSVLSEIGLFNESLRWNEDDDLWFRFMLKKEVRYSSYVSGFRRLHDQNMSLNRLKMNFFQIKTFVHWLRICRDENRKTLKEIIKKRAWPLAWMYIKTTIRRGKIDLRAIYYYGKIILS